MSELEKGNGFLFATGKEARKEERQLAREFKYVEMTTKQGPNTCGYLVNL